MTQEDFISIHRNAIYLIVDGKPELIGKKTKIKSIHFSERLIKSAGGLMISIDHIRAELKPIQPEYISDNDAYLIFKGYWGNSDTVIYRDPQDGKDKKLPINADVIMKIIDGHFFVAPDFIEMRDLHRLLIDKDFDVYDGIKNGWAVIKQNL